MPFPFDEYPWAKFEDLNIAYMIHRLGLIISEANAKLEELDAWKTATEQDLESWKNSTMDLIAEWEREFMADVHQWEHDTEQDLAQWKIDTIAALDTWKATFITQYEALRVETEHIRDVASAAAQEAVQAANSAEGFAELAENSVNSFIQHEKEIYNFTEFNHADFSEMTANGYLRNSDYTISPANDWHTSDIIKIRPGNIIRYDLVGHAAVASLAFYDVNNSPVSHISPEVSHARINGVYVVPDNIAGFRYSVRVNDQYGSENDTLSYTEYKNGIFTIVGVNSYLNLYLYESERNSENLYFKYDGVFMILAGESRRQINWNTLLEDLGLTTSDLVSSPDGTANCLIIPAGYALCIKYSTKKFSFVEREKTTPDDLIIMYSNYGRADELHPTLMNALMKRRLNNVGWMTLMRKIWNVMGDSITANPAYADTRYFEAIAKRNHSMTIRNYGIGGSRIGGTSSDAMCNRVHAMASTGDFVTVFGGVNDYGQPSPTPLGQFGDSTNTTFYGALKILCEELLNRYPSKCIVFLTPIQPDYSGWSVGTGANSLGFTIYDYADAIIRTCGYYGIPVVDLCRECGFSARNSIQKSTYFYDGLHLNNAGHNKISYLIEDALIKYGRGKTFESYLG